MGVDGGGGPRDGGLDGGMNLGEWREGVLEK